MVLVSEDNTSCTITLRGKGSGTTMGGNSIGEEIVLPLNAGHVFMVSGMGISDDFDLTGTSIKADKPIGLISFHERAKIPEGVRGGHDQVQDEAARHGDAKAQQDHRHRAGAGSPYYRNLDEEIVGDQAHQSEYGDFSGTQSQ